MAQALLLTQAASHVAQTLNNVFSQEHLTPSPIQSMASSIFHTLHGLDLNQSSPLFSLLFSSSTIQYTKPAKIPMSYCLHFQLHPVLSSNFYCTFNISLSIIFTILFLSSFLFQRSLQLSSKNILLLGNHYISTSLYYWFVRNIGHHKCYVLGSK